MILADSSASADFLAADLMAQAEHDPMARTILISMDKDLLKKVKALVPREKLYQCQLIFESSVTKAIEKLNKFAGEHVELMVRNPQSLLARVKNAGALFIGPYSPAVMGDYWAGPSHVLPTGRSATFSSGLSVANFMKRSSLIEIGPKAFIKGGKAAFQMAMAEGLLQHAKSIKVRV